MTKETECPECLGRGFIERDGGGGNIDKCYCKKCEGTGKVELENIVYRVTREQLGKLQKTLFENNYQEPWAITSEVRLWLKEIGIEVEEPK